MRKQTGDDFTEKLQQFFQTEEENFNQANKPTEIKPGSRCPVCRTGILDYDGTLNLICKQCSAVSSTGGACT